MTMLDIGLTVINVILAIVSGIGAYKSAKYFQKSKNLTIFAQINKALVEVQKMLVKLPEALSASNLSRRGKKGLSLHNTLLHMQEVSAVERAMRDIRPSTEYINDICIR